MGGNASRIAPPRQKSVHGSTLKEPPLTASPPSPAQPDTADSLDLAKLYDDAPDGAAVSTLPSFLGDRDAEEMRHVFTGIKRGVVGQARLVQRLLVALLARGHVLPEGV